jgi:hypothetical protein
MYLILWAWKGKPCAGCIALIVSGLKWGRFPENGVGGQFGTEWGYRGGIGVRGSACGVRGSWIGVRGAGIGVQGSGFGGGGREGYGLGGVEGGRNKGLS